MKDENNFQVESLYDHSCDVLGIRIIDNYEYETSVELSNDVILDFDINNVPVALEILNASKVLKVPKYALNNIPMIQMNVDVDEKSISLKACFGVIIHNKEQIHSVDSFTSNDTGIPNIVTELATA